MAALADTIWIDIVLIAIHESETQTVLSCIT